MTHSSTSLQIEPLRSLFQQKQEDALRDFFTFLSFPSISSEAEYRSDVRACVSWLQQYLKEMEFETELWETGGHPVLYASHCHAQGKPTLLIYNHYDVQPVDPLEEWQSPPFTPTLKNGEVYARGAQDNKGQCFYVLYALKLLLERDRRLPINVKLCIEGEEECGSAGISKVLAERRQKLQADYLAIVDLGLRTRGEPALTLGLRGLVTMDLSIEGSHYDLHSGMHGGLVYNPLHALVKLLAELRDEHGRVKVPGFYDQVKEPSPEEKSLYRFDFDKESYLKQVGAEPTGGEKEFSPLERGWLRPTLEINGVSGGYRGAGFKTVIPARAEAKISCRLVPNQNPLEIGQKVKQFLESNAPEGVSVKVQIHPGCGTAIRTSPNSKGVQAFSQAFEEVFSRPCSFILDGASIPIVPELAQASGGEVILLGLGLPDDQIHAPNEHFGWDRIEQGFLIIARALQLLA